MWTFGNLAVIGSKATPAVKRVVTVQATNSGADGGAADTLQLVFLAPASQTADERELKTLALKRLAQMCRSLADNPPT